MVFRQFLILLVALLNHHEAIVRLDQGSQHPDTKRIEIIKYLMCTAFLAFFSSNIELFCLTPCPGGKFHPPPSHC